MSMLRPSHYRRLRGERSAAWSTSAVLGVAAAIGTVIGIGPSLGSLIASPTGMTASVSQYGEQVEGCTVTDGDTIRCGSERIRLLGIDAPELPGHCREGRQCAPGDAQASTDTLAAAMSPGMTIDRVGVDRYGRTLARVAGGEGDLSCWQLSHHQAIYKPNWDNGLRVARTCPRAAF
jgi:endonuclease YncB( thermonuclease family)